jgi:hypothetical protein
MQKGEYEMRKKPNTITHPRFDPTVNLGHLLTMTAVMVSLVGGAYVFDYRLTAIEKQLEKMQSVFLATAVFEERLNSVNRRLDSLEARPR